MPVADRGRARARPAWLFSRAGGMLLLGAALALASDFAAAASKGHSHHNTNTSNDDGNNSGNSGGAPSSSSSSSGGGSSSGTDGNPVGPGNATSNNGNRGSGGGPDSNPFHASPSHPTLGVGFNNDGASVSIRAPLGGAPHAVTPMPREGLHHPLLTVPFGRQNGGQSGSTLSGAGPTSHHVPSHVLSYGNSPLTGSSDANPLTTRLIHGVTSTLSNHFADKLGNSLRSSQTPIAAVAPRGSPAALVRDRFVGFASSALEPRVFTLPMPGERIVANEIVVGVPSGLSGTQLAAFAQRNGLAPVGNGVPAAGITLQRWRITDARPVGDVVRALQTDADVQTAQPNYRFRLAQTAGLGEAAAAGEYSVQYAPAKLHLAQAHAITNGQGVLVAVIDTGIDQTHPEIAGAIAASYDAAASSEPPDRHGTGIAGAIVAHGRLTGVAPGAQLLAIRAFDNSGPDAEATTVTIVRSIEWAVQQGARVINMSFAGARDPLIARSIAAAHRKGIVLVAAAGNAGPNSPALYPAADPNVIAVSATDVDDHLLAVANRGREVAVAAPGVELLLPAPGARYQMATGTSFAAAHVAGIVALLIARNPQMTPDLVRTVLTASARDLGPKGRDDEFGAGLADAYKAVLAAGAGGASTLADAQH
jgi:hypothetical protein